MANTLVNAIQPDRPTLWIHIRRTLFSVLVLGVLVVFCAPIFTERLDKSLPPATRGVLDLSQYDLRAPIELAGEWAAFWISPGQHPGPILVKTPGEWRGIIDAAGAPLPRTGRILYKLTINGLSPGRYTLHVPTIFAASQVSIDGAVMSSRGHLGIDADSSRTQWRSHEVEFTADGTPIVIGIEIAAFHHRSNGIEATPVLGSVDAMHNWIALNWSKDFLFHVSLLVLSVYGVAIFLFRRADHASLYFGLSCFFFLPPVAIFGHDNLVLLAFPDLDFRTMLTVQYLTGILAIGFFLAYAHALFPKESPKWVFRTLSGAFFVSFVWQAYVLLVRGDTMLASATYPLSMIVTIVALLYMVIVVAFATLHRRDGAAVFLIGIGFFAVALTIGATVANGVLDADQAFGLNLLPLGMLVLLFSHAVVLAERLAVAIATAEDMATDLRRLIDVSSSVSSEMRLEQLLDKLVRATSTFLNADRSSIFLYDPAKSQLWSIVAQGVERREIRFDAATGLAGATFTTGEVISVVDAYQDDRFNSTFDYLTGYRTRSVLSMPLVARDGRRIGVMQALNRRDGRPFTDVDAARMSAFASQAAIAVENATLFSEVLAAKTYNESILDSMTNGVVTFEHDGSVASVNPAAAQILDIDPRSAIGTSAETLLPGNLTLFTQLDNVRTSGERRSLLDVDMQTGSGKDRSANLTLVPFTRGNSRREDLGGVLMLIEDVSDEKRLESTMRRFMTQEVVDQVLNRQDELLFGSSCKASVLFADIRNFSSLAESLTPRETVEMLNEVFGELVEAVTAAGGVVDKFMGDCVMAVFGAPLSTGRDANNAVLAAVEMMRLLPDLNRRRERKGQPGLRLGIGIATGDVVAGTIGSPRRMEYTVIGDSVNLASRLQTITKTYQAGIVACSETAAQILGDQAMRELDMIRVRGRQRPERIYQLLGYHTEHSFPNMAAVVTAYNRGRQRMLERAWDEAIVAFEEACRLNDSDKASALMLERARVLREQPPTEGWNGVWAD